MRQLDFTTNIEKRMPKTGEVVCIDRMTSDYAEQHPFDVDGFIEGVFQEFAGTEFEASREELHRVWTAVLSVTSPCGDPSIFPNKNGAKRAAAMKVWHKAGDYWRRGLRVGDTLPDRVPMTTITRMDDGWIALFPKDKHLLNEKGTANSEKCEKPAEHEDSSTPELLRDFDTNDHESATNGHESTGSREEPRQLDLFAQLQQENETLQARIAELERRERERREQECAERLRREEASRRARPQPAPVRSQQRLDRTAAEPFDSPAGDSHPWLKTVGYLAAACVALLVIWQTGLIIPLGLIGLATSGILK